MRKWLQILVSIVGILLALCLAHTFNICDYMTFIPKDKSYDVCITVYFAMVEVIASILLSMILDWIEGRKVNVEVIMFASNEAPNKASCPIIKFNKMGIAEINMKVSVSGKRKNINNNNIVLNSMRQVEYQLGRKGTGAKVDDAGNFIVEIDKICNAQDVIGVEETYKIVLQRGDLEDSSVILLTPKLINNCKYIDFIANEVKLTLEGK